MRRQLDVVWRGKRVWDSTRHMYVSLHQEEDLPQIVVQGPRYVVMELCYGAKPEPVMKADTWTVPKAFLYEGTP